MIISLKIFATSLVFIILNVSYSSKVSSQFQMKFRFLTVRWNRRVCVGWVESWLGRSTTHRVRSIIFVSVYLKQRVDTQPQVNFQRCSKKRKRNPWLKFISGLGPNRKLFVVAILPNPITAPTIAAALVWTAVSVESERSVREYMRYINATSVLTISHPR